MIAPDRAGALLAQRHRRLPAESEPTRSLVNYAEAPRMGDWTLRSALVRLAQPEPVRAGAVLELVRRLDAAFHSLARALERHTVVSDRSLSPDTLTESPIEPIADGRATDIARLIRAMPDGEDDLLAAYLADAGESVGDGELSEEERAALPLLAVALTFDDFAARLARWAYEGAHHPPIDDIDQTCAVVYAELEALGVAREEPLDRPGGRPRR